MDGNERHVGGCMMPVGRSCANDASSLVLNVFILILFTNKVCETLVYITIKVFWFHNLHAGRQKSLR